GGAIRRQCVPALAQTLIWFPWIRVESNRSSSVRPLYTFSRGKGTKLLQLAMRNTMGMDSRKKTPIKQAVATRSVAFEYVPFYAHDADHRSPSVVDRSGKGTRGGEVAGGCAASSTLA